MTTNDNISATEATIVRQLLAHAFSLGYTVSVNDGEEWVVRTSTDAQVITAALASTDQDILRFHKEGAYIGNVWLIWGNDEDLISDNTDNEATNHLVDHLQLVRF